MVINRCNNMFHLDKVLRKCNFLKNKWFINQRYTMLEEHKVNRTIQNQTISKKKKKNRAKKLHKINKISARGFDSR